MLPDGHGAFRLRILRTGPLLVQLSASRAPWLFPEPDDALRLKMDPEKATPTFCFQAGDGMGHAPTATAHSYLAEFSQRFIEAPEFQLLPANIRLREPE